jgi:hypothetical protein
LVFLALATASAFQQNAAPPGASVQELRHFSQVMGATRVYRVFLPPAYASSQTRYPVVYWLHGLEPAHDQEAYSADIAKYVAAHDLIVVDAGPVETVGNFPLYFAELVEHIDHTLRTIPDRGHRAVTGYSQSGFMALWTAGKFPDLVSSASDFMGYTESPAGPAGFDTETALDDLYGNYDGVRTRLVTGSRDFLRFYERRLNAIWSFAAPHHETEEFESDHGTPGVAKTLDFHMRAFAEPLPQPAVFSHADDYPNFSIWGWEVASNRRQPGFTALENVSAKGFHSAVREWLPGGAAISPVKLSIATPVRLYQPGSAHPVTVIHLADGKVRRTVQKADAQGRLNFDLDGDEYEVGISAEPAITVSGFEVADAAWATAGKPVKLRVRFWNVGAVRSNTLEVQWTSPNPGVQIDTPSSQLFGLASGESAAAPVTFTVSDPLRAVAKIVASIGASHIAVDVPLFPPAEPVKNFLIADGRTLETYQNATRKADLTLREGNGDGYAAPGESFAVLLPDGDSFRAAELFTNDACIDNTVRLPDSWNDYDHSGASVKYSVPRIRPECQPGHVVHMLARIVVPHAPDHQARYAALEFPVWWRHPEDAAKK